MQEAQQPKILIVDDDRAILVSYTIILERLGYAVSTADSSAEGMTKLRAGEYDLLICDLTLDHAASGLHIIEAARHEHPSLAVILMTGYSDAELPPHLAKTNVQMIAKPANIPYLLETIKKLLAEPSGASRVVD